jgi:hypothetical protein
MLLPSQFPEAGLYLLFPDGDRVDLTRRRIEETTNAYLSDPSLIPASVKAAADYTPCTICPERDRAKICHAIMPVLPFVQGFEDYLSCDSVTAVYREEEGSQLVVAETSMQKALQYITLLGLTKYCEVGSSFAAYFKGVNPLMPIDLIAERVFGNMYLCLRGDLGALQQEAARMQEQTFVITECQVRRLHLISRSDALANAFANTHSVALLIFLTINDRIEALATPARPGALSKVTMR